MSDMADWQIGNMIMPDDDGISWTDYKKMQKEITRLHARLTAAEAVLDAAREVRCEYFTAYPTEGELLKRMQALDAALRFYRAAKEE